MNSKGQQPIRRRKLDHLSKAENSPQLSTIMERLHPSLRNGFISLPGNNTPLTREQLKAIFGGDLKALREVIKLIQHRSSDAE